MSDPDGFFEPDEPVEQVVAAFERGEKQVTTPPAIEFAPWATFDHATDVGYLYLPAEAVEVARTVELSPTVHLALAADGTLVGVKTIGGPVNYAALYVVLTHGWAVALAEGSCRAASYLSEMARELRRLASTAAPTMEHHAVLLTAQARALEGAVRGLSGGVPDV